MAAVAALLLTSACAWRGGAIPEPPGGSIAVSPATALSFHRRIDAFYRRLTRRRFNALETFNDPVLRDHFHSQDLFFDYYADLAESLAKAHFEKSRPRRFEVRSSCSRAVIAPGSRCASSAMTAARCARAR